MRNEQKETVIKMDLYNLSQHGKGAVTQATQYSHIHRIHKKVESSSENSLGRQRRNSCEKRLLLVRYDTRIRKAVTKYRSHSQETINFM